MKSNTNLILGSAAFHGLRAFKRRQKHVKIVFNTTLVALIVLVSILIQAIGPINTAKLYALSPEMQELAGKSRDDSSKYLKLEEKTGNYKFEVPKDTETSKEHTGRKVDAYSASFAKDPKEGISFTDTATNITLKMIPKFSTQTGQKTEGDHIVYPFGPNKLTYTLKYNGLKEDIILPTFQGDSLDYTFELVLPTGVEARLDEQGNIGIYSADTTLYGNISFGSDKDQELIDKARENGQKTHLVATIPYPIVKDSSGKEHSDLASFSLDNMRTEQTKAAPNQNLPAEVQAKLQSKTTQRVYDLKLEAKNLKNLSYPISIDPTFTTTSAADFSKVNFEGGAEIDNTSIKRGSMTGAELETWQTNPTNSGVTGSHSSAFYNGYVYVQLYGAGTVYYASINSNNGQIGTFNATSTSGNCDTNALRAYNGYLYRFGAGSNSNAVSYAKINANGTLGTWTATASFVSPRRYTASIIYNGYAYIAGGFEDNTGLDPDVYYGDVQYAQVKADGSLSAWASTTSMSTGRIQVKLVAYNGYIYAIEGSNDGTLYTDVRLAKVNSNGTIGAWRSTTSTPSYQLLSVYSIHNGYLYRLGNNTTTEYAPIYANGDVGTWRATTAFATNRNATGGGFYNGYLYVIGGQTGLNDIQYTTVKPAGWIGAAATTSAMTTGRSYSDTVVYNGFIYVTGGCTDQSSNSGSAVKCNTASTSVEYGTLNTSGTITWNGTTTALPAGRWGHQAAAANGYIYVTAGCTVGAVGACTQTGDVLYSAINATTGALTGGWTTRSNRITTNRMAHSFVVYNGYGYVMGGMVDNSRNTTFSTQYLQFDADGTVPNTNWSTGTNIPDPGSGSPALRSATVYAGYLYFVDLNGAVNIYYMDISGGAATGSWTTNSETIGSASYQSSIFAYNGYLYLYNTNGTTWSSYYGKINTNGSISGVIANATNTVGAASPDDAYVVYNGYVYKAGGCNTYSADDCNSTTTTVSYAPINNGGSGGTTSWTLDGGGNFAAARTEHCTAILNGYLYVIGGAASPGAGAVETVYYAPLSSDGSVGTWASTTQLTGVGRRSAGCTTYNGAIYLIGGFNSSNNAQDSVVHGKPVSNGTIPSWTLDSTHTLSSVRHSIGAGAYNGYLYSIGGQSGSSILDTVEYAQLDPTTGALLTNWTATATLLTSRLALGSVINNGYIYALGGCTVNVACDTVNRVIASVEYAKLGSNGALVSGGTACGGGVTWCATTEMPAHIWNLRAIAINGFLYVIGGADFSDNSLNTVYVTEFTGSGNLGNWRATTAFPTLRNRATPAYHAGRIYVAGGNIGGTGQDTTYYTTPQSIPRLGSFSKMFDFDVGVKPTKLITRGTKQPGSATAFSYANTNNAATTFGAAVSSSDIGYTGANALSLSLGTNVSLSRYFYLLYTIDDTYSAVFPDVGYESNITDFDLYYTANPDKRLRGGRTFTNSTDRGLQASP